MTNFITKILDTYNKGLKYDSLLQSFNDLSDSYEVLDDTNEVLIKIANKTKKELTKLQEDLDKLTASKNFNVNEHKEWYINRREQRTWTYNGVRLGRKDVCKYLIPSDSKPFIDLANELINKYGLSPNLEATEIITKIYKYWNGRGVWKYAYDKDLYHSNEMWEDPTKALELRKGDCESKAQVMFNIMVEALRILDKEKDIWRLTFACAMVLGEGGHGFLTWLSDDGQYYIIESTYDNINSMRKTWLKTPVKNNNLYHNFWGFATHEKSWKGSNTALMSYKDFNK